MGWFDGDDEGGGGGGNFWEDINRVLNEIIGGPGSETPGPTAPEPAPSGFNPIGTDPTWGGDTQGGGGGGGFLDLLKNVGSKVPWESIGKSLIGPAVGAGAGALGDKLFPGQGGRVLTVDPRTEALQEAERRRLELNSQFNSQLTKAYGDPYYNTLPMDVQEAQKKRVKDYVRNARAGAGALETGGTVQQEADALVGYDAARAAERNRGIESLQGSALQSTGGYVPNQVIQTPAVPSPWAKILGRFGEQAGQNMNDIFFPKKKTEQPYARG